MLAHRLGKSRGCIDPGVHVAAGDLRVCVCSLGVCVRVWASVSLSSLSYSFPHFSPLLGCLQVTDMQYDYIYVECVFLVYGNGTV